jgi:hypothetical protein
MTERINTIVERIIERNRALGIEESEEIIRKAKQQLLELLAA